MEPIAYLQLFRRRWPILAIATLLGIGIGLATGRSSDAGPTQYEATHTLSLLAGQLDTSDGGPTTSLTPSQMAVFVEVGEVPQGAAAALDQGDSPQQLAGQVDAEADDLLGTIAITAIDTNPAQAVAIANTFANQLKEYVAGGGRESRQAQLANAQRQTQQLADRITALNAEIATNPPNADVLTSQRDILSGDYQEAFDQLQALQAQGPAQSPLTTLEPAVARTATANGPRLPADRPARAAVLGLIGLALGAALALVLDRIDTRVHNKRDAEAATGLTVFAEIPHLPRRQRGQPLARVQPPSLFIEAYRNLRTTLSFTAGPASATSELAGATGDETFDQGRIEPEVILITSPGPSEGKSTTVAWLATTYAESGRDVLVLDCDFRRPRLHEVFETRSGPGLSDSLIDSTRFSSDREVICDTTVPGVRLVPAGTPTDHAAQLFTRARRLIDASRQQADVVLIDTPPYLVANDAAQLVPFVDAVLVVLRGRRTSHEAAGLVAEQLDRYSVPVVGLVLVDIDQTAVRYGGYYDRAGADEDDPGSPRRWRPGRRGAEERRPTATMLPANGATPDAPSPGTPAPAPDPEASFPDGSQPDPEPEAEDAPLRF